jgi:hypothetical protein
LLGNEEFIFTKRMHSAPWRAIAIDECNNAASTNKASSMAAAHFGTKFL